MPNGDPVSDTNAEGTARRRADATAVLHAAVATRAAVCREDDGVGRPAAAAPPEMPKHAAIRIGTPTVRDAAEAIHRRRRDTRGELGSLNRFMTVRLGSRRS